MTGDETRRMELARRAWQASQPSEDEVRRAVRRIRLSAGSAPRGAVRRLPALAAAALVLGGALAYAANGGYSALIGDGFGARQHSPRGGGYGAAAAPTTEERPSGGKSAPSRSLAPAEVTPEAPAPPTPAPVAPAPQPQPQPAARGVGDETSTPTTGSSAQPSSAVGERASDVAARAASSRRKGAESSDSGWRQVGEALAAGDEARATRALNSLAHDSDPETRAKAELGLARLAASSGNCERARRLALGVARRPGLDGKLVERAHDVVLRCEGR